MRRLSAVFALCLSCALAAPGAGVSVLFDPARPEVGPFPTDFLTVPDPAQKTGLRVNLPSPDCVQQPTTCTEIELLNELDGFNLQPRARVRFSASIDPRTLPGGIFFVALDSVTDEEQGLHELGRVVAINQTVYDPETNTAYPETDEVLDQHHRYLLVVTDMVRDHAGAPVEAANEFQNCADGTTPGDYCDDLADALDAITTPGKPIAASLFTTLSATAWLESARRSLANVPVNFERTGADNVFQSSQLLAVTWRMHVGVDPPEFEDLTLPLELLSLSTVGELAFGSFETPRFLVEEQTIPTTPTGEETGPPEEVEKIPFHALLPSSARPVNGYPVVIFGHGFTDNQFGGSTLVAGSLAKAGFATVAIHAAGHGTGPLSSMRMLKTDFEVREVSLPGRGVDLDADGRIGSQEGCLILEPFAFTLSDCVRQTAVDLMQLTRAIREGMDLTGDGAVDFDGTSIYYVGQSLGAFYGTAFVAVEPDLKAAVLNVGGGSMIESARWGPSLRGFLRDVLAARTPAATPADAELNENYLLRGRPVKVNKVASAIEIQNVLERFEWRQMVGDPLAFAPHLARSPLTGMTPRPVLWQFAKGDRTVPNPLSAYLVQTAGMEESTSLYRHDLARIAAPTLADNPHVFLVDIRTTAGAGISQGAQDQMTGFLASGGTEIPSGNSLALRLLLGVDVFESPMPPPEELGFAFALTSVSAAGYTGPAAAPHSIQSAFGINLASMTATAPSIPLPTVLGGTRVLVTDSKGVEHAASLFFVSANQVNYLVPGTAASGSATVRIESEDGVVSNGSIDIEFPTPGIFTANASGQGAPAAFFLRVAPDGTQTMQLAFDDTAPLGLRQPRPIDLSGDDQVFLILFGTGMRDSFDARKVMVGGLRVDVSRPVAQGEFVGLDQVNVGPLPSALAGRGQVDVVLTLGDRTANVVAVSFL